MAHPHHSSQAASKAQSSPYVEVTFVFRDTLQKPIEGLSVQIPRLVRVRRQRLRGNSDQTAMIRQLELLRWHPQRTPPRHW